MRINSENTDLEKLGNILDEVCSQIAERFNLYSSNGKPRKATIIDAIANSTCLACIAKKLSRQATATNVDALYRECHKLAVNMLVEELYNLLSKMGYTVMVSSESKTEYGKVDVIITITNYGINLKSNTNELMVEVKTGVSLSLSQLFRYLLNKRDSTIVVWRVRRRQVLVFDVQDFEPLLVEFMKMCLMRGSRLLSSQQLPQCQHPQRLNWQPTQQNLQNMLQDFAKAVTETLPHVVKIILERLEVKMELNKPRERMVLNKRESKSIQMVASGNIIPVNQSKFLVRSQSDPNKLYEITWQRDRWCCNCEDYCKRVKRCKHIRAVCYYIAIQNLTTGVRNLNPESRCPKCGSETSVIKRGIRYNRSGPAQRYYCKKCKIRFVCRTAFQRMRSKATAIASALDLYFRGLSLRQVAEHLELAYGIKVTHGTIHNWIKKYVELVNAYAKTLLVNASSRWHMDDTLVRVSGRHMVLWTLLDSETRFLLSLHISSKRGAEEAQTLIRKGLKTAKTKPSELISDGLASYREAIEREFKSKTNKHEVIHVKGPLTAGFNNKIERFHGVLKNRVKTMGKLNSEKTAETFAKGFELYYNFIKPHKALNKRTPAQAAGLTPEKNNWLYLIRRAEKHTR